MPTYDYVCAACGHAFEQFQEMSAKKLRTCPKCKKPALERQVGAGAGLIFKGTGFYITDYKRSGAPEGGAKKSESGEKPAAAPPAPPASGAATTPAPASPAPAAPKAPPGDRKPKKG